MEEVKPSFVYCLLCSNGHTYIGATVDLERRLKQHNCKLAGGATATKTQVKRGHSWKRACYVKNFPTWQSALQFEWRWKQITRRIRNGTGMERRTAALGQLLDLESSTTAAIPFAQWPEPPEVVWETESENVCLD